MVVITIITTTILILILILVIVTLNLTILRIIIEQLIIFTIFKLCIRRYLQKLKKKTILDCHNKKGTIEHY